jgi:hypothetical protein
VRGGHADAARPKVRGLTAGGSRIRTHGPTLIASGYAWGVHGFHGWRLAALFELLGAPPVVFEMTQLGIGVLNQSKNCAVESA